MSFAFGLVAHRTFIGIKTRGDDEKDQVYLIPASLSTAALFQPAACSDKIFKIHSSEFRCRQSLRWKMDESSAA
jgi:hypothetical protein